MLCRGKRIAEIAINVSGWQQAFCRESLARRHDHLFLTKLLTNVYWISLAGCSAQPTYQRNPLTLVVGLLQLSRRLVSHHTTRGWFCVHIRDEAPPVCVFLSNRHEDMAVEEHGRSRDRFAVRSGIAPLTRSGEERHYHCQNRSAHLIVDGRCLSF